VQLELNMARDDKHNKSGFYRYVIQKGKAKITIPTLMSKTGKLVTTDKEKAEILHNFLATIFTVNLFPHLSSQWTARQGLEEQRPSHCK